MRGIFIAVVVCGLAAGAQAASPAPGAPADPPARAFAFVDDVPTPDRTYSLAAGRPWRPHERDMVRRDLEGLNSRFPEFVFAATAGETIAVARVAAVYGRPRALASARRQPRYLIIADRFYADALRGPNHLHVDYGLWTLVHELAHIVDQRKEISHSDRWQRLVGLRIAAFKLELAGAGKTLDDEIDTGRNETALSYGLPSSYAATTRTEAFAEYMAAYLLAPEFRMPYAIRDFMREMLSR